MYVHERERGDFQADKAQGNKDEYKIHGADSSLTYNSNNKSVS